MRNEPRPGAAIPVITEKLPSSGALNRIRMIRGHKVILDADLASLYGVQTRRLNEQVRRNGDRFPADFMFQLSLEETASLMSQIATSKKHGGRRKPAFAFTEHGALMAATVLNSERAVQVGLYVVRAFVQVRETLAQHDDLARKLAQLEKDVEGLSLRQGTVAADMRAQLKQVFEALRELMATPSGAKRPIGFVIGDSKKR